MKTPGSLTYLLKKYPLFRIAFLCIFASLLFLLFFMISFQTKKKPVLSSMTPQIGTAGDFVTLTGQYFGDTQEDSYVEIGGSKLTRTCYSFWSSSSIRIILPQNIQDGLVYVVTRDGRSEPKYFADRLTIPVLVRSDPLITTPVITEIDAKNPSIGSVISITGKNFGSLRSDSQVFFTANSEDISTVEYIVCSDTNPDYDFWSDTEIRVRIPDGSCSGNVYVQTGKGISNLYKIQLSSGKGFKKFLNKRTYLLSVSTDISSVLSIGEGTVTLRIPKPPVSSSQRMIEVPVSSPAPAIPDYMGTIVHQFPVKNDSTEKISVNHSFVVPVYAVETDIIANEIVPYSDKTLEIFSHLLRSDAVVLSDADSIKNTAKSITKGTVYQKARQIFDYMVKDFTLLQDINTDETSILNALESKTADAYDFALLYASLCRASGVICIPVSGVLIDANLNAKNHWWCEFYLENIGWVPSDPSLAAGLNYEPFSSAGKVEPSYYFGNLDSQHVAFSRGWNQIKQTNLAGKTVYRPKTYALQSIWEETSAAVQSYSSFWSNVYVMGVY